MQWADLVADSNLENLPYKIELNEHGQILMTPHWPLLSELQSVLLEELHHHKVAEPFQSMRFRPLREYGSQTWSGVPLRAGVRSKPRERPPHR